MQFLNFSEKIKLEKKDLIILYQGTDSSDKSFFAYIICEAGGISKLRNNYSQGNSAQLSEYGKVIYIDYKDAPDEKAEKYLADFIEHYKFIKQFL